MLAGEFAPAPPARARPPPPRPDRHSACAASNRVDQPAQVVHADAEMPFLHPAPRRIQPAFVIAAPPPAAPASSRRSAADARPRRKETAADHRIQHRGIARQIARQPRRGARQMSTIRSTSGGLASNSEKICTPAGRPGQKAVERHQRLVRVGGAAQAASAASGAAGGRSPARGPSAARDSCASRRRCRVRLSGQLRGRLRPRRGQRSLRSARSIRVQPVAAGRCGKPPRRPAPQKARDAARRLRRWPAGHGSARR